MSDDNGQGEDISHPLAMDINWKVVPQWAKWVGQCSDGVVVLYEHQPKIYDYGSYWHYLNNGGRYMFAGETMTVPKQYSLMCSPYWAH